jgi:hypothetical protein
VVAEWSTHYASLSSGETAKKFTLFEKVLLKKGLR